MRCSKELEALAQATTDFRNELAQLLKMMDALDGHDDSYDFRFDNALGPAPFSDDDLRAQREKVGQLSGAAAMAAAQAGVLVTVQDPAVIGGRIKTINPLQGWFQALEPHPLHLSANDVMDAANQTIGVLNARREHALQTERSLAGRVARVVGFADQVRAARGVQPDSKAGKVTLWVTVAAQVIGTILAAWALWLLGRAGAALVELLG